MDPFSSPSPSGSGSGLGLSNEAMMGQVKQQLAQAYAEEFFGVRIAGFRMILLPASFETVLNL